MKIRAKTVIWGLLALVVLLVLIGISAIGWQVVLGPDKRPVTAEKFDPTDARLERGRYLVEGPAHCFLCHSEHDFSTPEYLTIQAKKGAGWSLPIRELNNIAARNITPDVETGIGSWSDDEIARAIREGIRKDGTALFPVMPYLDFATLDDEDVKSIVVYLRTIPAVKNVVPKRHLPGPLEYIVNTIPKPLTTPKPSHPSSTPEERGKYWVTLAGCQGCHTPTDDKGQKLPGLDFAGGEEFADPGQNGKKVHSMNLTSDPSGIAHYDEALFIQTVHTGQLPGRFLNHIMPFESFKNFKDDDLKDIFAYLKSVPPVKHRVSNTDPPTKCEICGKTHGLGDMNKK
jgi:mono/diheme cytochrome c family protein